MKKVQLTLANELHKLYIPYHRDLVHNNSIKLIDDFNIHKTIQTPHNKPYPTHHYTPHWHIKFNLTLRITNKRYKLVNKVAWNSKYHFDRLASSIYKFHSNYSTPVSLNITSLQQVWLEVNGKYETYPMQFLCYSRVTVIPIIIRKRENTLGHRLM